MKKVLLAVMAIIGLSVGNNSIMAVEKSDITYVSNVGALDEEAKTKIKDKLNMFDINFVEANNLSKDMKFAPSTTYYFHNGEYNVGSYALFNDKLNYSTIRGFGNNVVFKADVFSDGKVMRNTLDSVNAQYNNIIFDGQGLDLTKDKNRGEAAIMFKGKSQKLFNVTIRNYGVSGTNAAIMFYNKTIDNHEMDKSIIDNLKIENVVNNNMSKGLVYFNQTGNVEVRNVIIDKESKSAYSVYLDKSKGDNEAVLKAESKISFTGKVDVQNDSKKEITFGILAQTNFGNIKVSGESFRFNKINSSSNSITKYFQNYTINELGKRMLVIDQKNNEYILENTDKYLLQDQLADLVAYSQKSNVMRASNKVKIKIILHENENINTLTIPSLNGTALSITAYESVDTETKDNNIDFVFENKEDEKAVEFDGFAKEEQIVDPGNNGNEGNEVKPSEKPSKPEVSTNESTKDQVKEKNKTKGVTKVSSKNTLPKTGSQLLTYLTIIVSIASITVLVRKKLN